MSECRTLIVDDEETYARALQRLLGRRGIEADVATTAAEGLHRARRHPYHLVVLDYMLPDGTGLDLIPPLRQLRPTPAVLMMTGRQIDCEHAPSGQSDPGGALLLSLGWR